MTLSDQKSNRRRSMNLLEVKGISKTYGAGETAVHALKNVFQFRKENLSRW